MSSKFFLDSYYQAAKLALDGLAARQAAISQNMANVDTPGYRAKTISFENAVRMVMENDTSFQMKTTDIKHIPASAQQGRFKEVSRRGGSLRADENNVDIDVEMIDMNETDLRFQAITQLVNGRFRLLKEISNSR